MKIIIRLLVLVILIGGAYFYWKDSYEKITGDIPYEQVSSSTPPTGQGDLKETPEPQVATPVVHVVPSPLNLGDFLESIFGPSGDDVTFALGRKHFVDEESGVSFDYPSSTDVGTTEYPDAYDKGSMTRIKEFYAVSAPSSPKGSVDGLTVTVFAKNPSFKSLEEEAGRDFSGACAFGEVVLGDETGIRRVCESDWASPYFWFETDDSVIKVVVGSEANMATLSFASPFTTFLYIADTLSIK
jgi:hypothetical protein